MNARLITISLLLVGGACDPLPDSDDELQTMPAQAKAKPKPDVDNFEQALSGAPNLVARVRLSKRHALEIFELDDKGTLGYSEVGSYGVPPMERLTDEEMNDPLALVRRLAPGQEVPQRLVDLAQKRRQRGASLAIPPGERGTAAGPLPTVKRTALRREPSPESGGNSAEAGIEIQGQAVHHAPADGTLGDTCPWSAFQTVWGPLGAFCPEVGGMRGDLTWCLRDIGGSTEPTSTLDALAFRTKSSVATLCSDEGNVALRVTWGAPACCGSPGGVVGSTTFHQPQGTWRQYYMVAGCSGNWLTGKTCDNHSVKYEAIGPGWAHFGGAWNRW